MAFWSKLFYKAINKKTREEKLEKRIKILLELIEMKQREKAKEPGQYASNVIEDYALDSFIVSKKDGSVLMSTEKEQAFEKAVKSTSLHEFIKSEFPDANLLIIKDKNNYNVLYTENDLTYIFRTSGDISAIETRQIVKKINEGIKNFKLN